MKTKFIFPLLIFICCSLNLFSQSNWLWAKSAGGTNVDRAYSIAIDGSGNSYVTGIYYSSTITFGSTTLTNASANREDVFLVKYDQNGNVLWATSGNGTKDDYAYSITVDAAGNSYIAGNFESPTITFGSTTLTNIDVGGSSADMFLVKYDPSGNLIWAKSEGALGWDFVQSVTVDASGNSFITGNFQATSLTFGTTTLVNSSSSYELFIVKYDPLGNVIWAKGGGGISYAQSNSIVADAIGDSYITGYFSGSTITFGSTTLTNAGADDVFLVKYDPSGNVLWGKSAGGIYSEHPNSVSFDALGNSYVTGSFDSPTFPFASSTLNNAGSWDVFLLKFDPSGNALWANGTGGNADDQANSVTVDASGNSYIAGYFYSPTIAFGSATITNSDNIHKDLFLAKYNPSGNVIWAKSAVGIDNDVATSVAVDGSGNCYIAGSFDGPTIIFDADTLTNHASVGKIGDVFIAKADNLEGIKSAEAISDNISIFPNPSKGNFTVKNNFSNNYEIEIFNSLGQEIFRKEKINQNSFEVDLSNQSNGIYFAQLIADGKIYSQKIIVEK